MQYRLRPGQSNFIYNGETIKRSEVYTSEHGCVRKMPERFYIFTDTPIEAQPEPDCSDEVEVDLEAFLEMLDESLSETKERLADPEE
jgi:hypothetical protein